MPTPKGRRHPPGENDSLLALLTALSGAPGVREITTGDMWAMVWGDSLQILAALPDRSVDAILTDPPYANDTPYRSYRDTPENLRRLVATFMPQALRVAKRTLVTCGVANIHLYPKPTWTLCWVTPAGVGSGPWGFCCWQPILAYGEDPYLAEGQGRFPDTLILTTAAEHVDHPCPKPLRFMRWLVERGSLPGELVLDPFMGSGTTVLAALQLGRWSCGIEIDEVYYRQAVRRLQGGVQAGLDALLLRRAHQRALFGDSPGEDREQD